MTHRRRMPSASDLLLALGTAVATLAALVGAPELLEPGEVPPRGDGAWWIAGVALALQAALLCVARLAPSAVLVGTAGVAMLLGVLSPTGIASLAGAAVLLAVLRAALLVPTRRLRVLLPLAGALVAIGQAADLHASTGLPVPAAIGSGLLQAVVIVVLPAVGVLAVTARRDARIARTGESAAMAREQDALVQAAIAQERTGMARELHDIAAHHVSSIALMAAAIERQIDADPEGAKRSVRQVRNQSRALLDDLRRLVGLLRDADDADVVETLDTVGALVDGARATGRSVTLHVVAGGGEVGPLGQLVVHRMVQESLANAARHAPGAPCVVELDGSGADRFIATVRNAPSPHASSSTRDGLGLLGMRERAALVGGSVTAGADDDGGWTVRLVVPSERRAPEGDPA